MKLNTFKDTTHIKIRGFSHLGIADFFTIAKQRKIVFIESFHKKKYLLKNLNNLHYFDTFEGTNNK